MPTVLALAALALASLPSSAWAAKPKKARAQVDVPADTRSLREADQALARAVAERDPEAFAALIEEDALFAGGQRILDGRIAVSTGWAPFFTIDGPRLEWTPELAELSRSGDVGYTIGRSSYRVAPKATPSEGRYVTVWRRAPDGRFRVAIDMSLRPPDPALPEPLIRTPRRTVTSTAGDLEATAGTFTASGESAGVYLRIRRRGPDGALADALESRFLLPPAPAPRE